MTIIPIDNEVSACIAGVVWDTSNQLHIKFRTGACYCYFGVPEYVAILFPQGNGAGKYFTDEIRDIYPFVAIPSAAFGLF